MLGAEQVVAASIVAKRVSSLSRASATDSRTAITNVSVSLRRGSEEHVFVRVQGPSDDRTAAFGGNLLAPRALGREELLEDPFG